MTNKQTNEPLGSSKSDNCISVLFTLLTIGGLHILNYLRWCDLWAGGLYGSISSVVIKVLGGTGIILREVVSALSPLPHIQTLCEEHWLEETRAGPDQENFGSGFFMIWDMGLKETWALFVCRPMNGTSTISIWIQGWVNWKCSWTHLQFSREFPWKFAAFTTVFCERTKKLLCS